MIRPFTDSDLGRVMQLWLETNRKAHSFIPSAYWTDHYEPVKAMLPQAALFVCENDATGCIEGFIGLMGNEVAGLFVADGAQSKGVGKRLLDHAKHTKDSLRLHVYQKNTRAAAFYLREQFVVQAETVDTATGEAEFIMAWRR